MLLGFEQSGSFVPLASLEQRGEGVDQCFGMGAAEGMKP